MFTLIAALAIGASGEVPVIWTGEYSAVKETSVRVIDSSAEWMKVWHAHIGKPEQLTATLKRSSLTPGGYPFHDPVGVPNVDFSKNVVLVRFGGSKYSHAGYELKEGIVEGDTLTLRIQPRWYGSMGTRPPSAPFGFFVLPKTFTKLKVEEGYLEGENKQNPVSWRLILGGQE